MFLTRCKPFVAGALSLMLLTSAAKSFANNDLPDLGTAAVNTFSLEKEMIYGDAICVSFVHRHQCLMILY